MRGGLRKCWKGKRRGTFRPGPVGVDKNLHEKREGGGKTRKATVFGETIRATGKG